MYGTGERLTPTQLSDMALKCFGVDCHNFEFPTPNTVIFRTGAPDFADVCIFHETTIVEHYGKLTLIDTGGWATKTTVERINYMLTRIGLSVHVSLSKNTMRIHTKDWATEFPFENTIHLIDGELPEIFQDLFDVASQRERDVGKRIVAALDRKYQKSKARVAALRAPANKAQREVLEAAYRAGRTSVLDEATPLKRRGQRRIKVNAKHSA